MKRYLCFLLCLLMLFCVSCQKEDPAIKQDTPEQNDEELELGTLYTSGGSTYNTHVRIRLVNEDTVAPVKTVTVEVQNDTDYRVTLGRVDEWVWEKWENGAWEAVKSEEVTVHPDLSYTDSVAPQSTRSFSKTFQNGWESGSYRLRHAVSARPSWEDLPDPNKKDFECIVEVYFTITSAQNE